MVAGQAASSGSGLSARFSLPYPPSRPVSLFSALHPSTYSTQLVLTLLCFLSQSAPPAMSAYRRRDNTGYSSADAYRTVPNTSPSLQHARGGNNNNGAASSSEEDHLTSPVSSPQPPPGAPVYMRSRGGSRSRTRRESADQGGEPLSPPRPGFLVGEDRRSWSASSGANSETEPTSDSDASAAGLAGVGAGASQPARPTAGTNAARVPIRGHDRVRSNSSQQAGRTPVPAQSRTRNHRRRSSMAYEHAYAASVGEDEPQSPSSQGHSSYGMSNPFGTPNDTPRNSFYGGQYSSQGPAVPDKNTRSPPSAFPSFPFQSHAGNPDPGTHIPGIGRRESLDSLAARAQNGQVLHTPGNVNPHPLSPPGSGTVYPAGVAPGGYGLVEEGGEDLGRPYAPFMGDAPDRSQTPPTPSSASQLYRGSAAAAAAGKGEYGQYSFSRSLPPAVDPKVS